MADIDVTTRDNRRLGVTSHGDPAARRVVVWCHPSPGAGGFDPDPIATQQSGVHVIAIDRPGYGASDPWPADSWPSIAATADDIAEYLISRRVVGETLGTSHDLSKVSVAGWAGGGRVALALAARHPHLVDKVAVVAATAPQTDLQWVDEAIVELITSVRCMPAAEARQRVATELQTRWMHAFPPEDEEAHVPLDILSVGRADAAALEMPGLRERLDVMLREAFRQGIVGFSDSFLAFARPWGFEMADVAAPTLLVYGGDDQLAGHDHAEWYARSVPNATLEVVPDAGHLVIAPQWRRVLEFLGGE